MKKTIRLFTAMATLGLLCSCQQKHNLVVEIDGWGNDTIYTTLTNLIDYSESDVANTIFVAKGGRVILDVQEPMFVRFDLNNSHSMANYVYALVLPTAEINITGKKMEDRTVYTATGTDFMVDFIKGREQLMSYDLAIDSINKLIERDGITEEYYEGRNKQFSEREKSQNRYILSNHDTDLAAYYAFQQSDLDIFFIMHSELGDQAKNGVFKDYLAYIYKDMKNRQLYQELTESNVISAGNPAPDFTLKTVDGADFSLADLKGKWVVLDFWGTWCGYCINGVPDMKQAYEKYKDKMEIVGIACYDKADKVKIAIDEHQMNWTHLMNDGSVHASYAVGSYPTKIIIDPTGVIAYSAVGESPEFYAELDKLMAK